MNDIQPILADYMRRRYARLQPIAALVDMDGTLYDSMGNHADAWLAMAREAGFDVKREEIFLWEGMTGAQVIDMLMMRTFGRHASDDECKELYHRKTELFRAMPQVAPMPGAQDLIRLLQSVGMRLVLVTGSGQNSLLDRIDTDYPGAFPKTMRVTSHDVTHGKPHPEPYIRAMQLASVKPSQAIAIENAPLGVKSAATAGALAVGVVTGPIPEAELLGAGATVVYGSMGECADAFPTLLYHIFTMPV